MSQRRIEPVVLNAGPRRGGGRALAALGAELRERLARIAAAHADPATGGLDYRGIRGSADFAAIVTIAQELVAGRPADLATADEQIAFWLNLYNALALHGVIVLDIRAGVGEVHEFFRRIRYDVGGDGFSLVDIEHGVLRQNRPSRNQPDPPFAPGDPRRRWTVARFDPRIHFALVCGTRSCPPIRAYDAGRLDAQLDLATRAFVTADVEADPARRTLTISRLFHWYADDFDDVPGFIVRHLDPGPTREWLAARPAEVTVAHRDYDWDLNDAVLRS